MLTQGMIAESLRKFEKRQFKMAFEKGTEEAWDRYTKEVNKKIDYLNKDIAKWNSEHPLNMTDTKSYMKNLSVQLSPIDKKYFWSHN